MKIVVGIVLLVIAGVVLFIFIDSRRAERQHRQMREKADKKRFERGFGDYYGE